MNKTDSKVDLFDKFSHFMKFLLEQRSIFEYEMANLRITHSGGESDSGTVNHGTNFNSTKSENLKNRCIFHKTNGHSTDECRDFSSKSPQEKLEFLKQARACWCCMRDCRNRKHCEIDGCNLYHHPTLHGNKCYCIYSELKIEW